MKFKNLFLFLVTIAVAFVIAGCKKPQPEELTEYNVLGNWVESGDVYTITTNTTDKLAFTYDKGSTPDAYMESAEITKDLSVLKKLVITVQGTGTLLVKVENATTSKEVSLNVTGIKGTFEWNFLQSSDFLKTVKAIKIIAAPGKENSVGNIEVTELKFKNTVAEGYIIQDDFNNIPSNVNEYNGTDDEFHFNAKWENFSVDDNTYTIAYEGDVTKVTFDKPAGLEWSCMQTRIQGDWTDFNYVIIVVKGTAGQGFIAKAANGVETKEVFNGNEQTVVIDLTKMTLDNKKAITSIILFGRPGSSGTGAFDIVDAYMIADYEVEEPNYITNEYNGTDDTFAIVNWYDVGDKAYTITNDDETSIAYNKIAGMHDWSYAASFISGDISDFSKIEFVLTGTAGKTALLKIEGAGENIELNVTFDGTEQTFSMMLSNMSKTALQAVNKVMIFAAPGAAGSGTITVHSVTFTSEYNITQGWVDNGDDVYTFVDNTNGSVTVNYTKAVGKEWALMKQEFEAADVTGYNTLTMQLTGTAGKKVTVKVNGTTDYPVTFEADTVATVKAEAETFTSVFIFAEGGDVASGTFTIVHAALSYVQPELTDPMVDVNSNWVDSGDGVYTITENQDGTVKVDYTKAAGQDWATMKQMFEGPLAVYNVFSIEMTGTAAKQVLVKINNSIENWVTFDENGQGSAVVKADRITSVHLFGEGGVIVDGSFTIVKATLSHELNVNEDWVDSGDSVYTITPQEDGSIKVDYTKAVGKEWATMKQNFGNKESMYNTFSIVLKGTASKQVLVKLNNVLEKLVTFDANGDGAVSVTLDKINQVLLFAEGGAVTNGTFTIVSAKLSYVPPILKPATDANENWVDTGDGVYTITENEDGTVKVDYTKAAGKEWATMNQVFEGDLAGFNTFSIVMKGTATKQVLVKINNQIESWVTFDADGNGATLVKTGIINSVHLFAEGGVIANGSFTIISAELSYQINVNSEWVDNGDEVYTITKNNDGTVTVAYTKATGDEWSTMKQVFVDDFAKYNLFSIELTGTATKQVLVKINNAIEKWITFDANGKGSVVVTADAITSVLLFAEGGTIANGTFTIVSATLSYIPKSLKYTVDINSEWVDSGDAVYVMTENEDGSVKVDYTKAAGKEWATMKQVFEGDWLGYNTFAIVMTGTATKQVLVKINNTIEKWVTFDADGNGEVIVTAPSITSVHLFAEGGVIANGTFTIVSAKLSYEVDVNCDWVDSGDTVYAITENENGTVDVVYTKAAGKEWAAMKHMFEGEELGYNTFIITLEGTATKQVLVKINNAVEKWVTFDADGKGVATVTADSIVSVHLFAEGGNIASGTFKITSAHLSLNILG